MAFKFSTAACAAVAALSCAAVSARAQGTTRAQEGWQFAVTPYVWIAGVSGTVTTPFQRVPAQDVTADFGDVLSNLSGFAFMGAAEVRYGRFALLGDVMTLSVESDVSTPRGALFSGGRGRFSATTGSVLGLFRVLDDGRNALDLGAGARPWSVSAKLSLDPGLLAGRTVKVSSSWIDPVIAARYTLRLDERWRLTAYADVGGFGAGSELTWQVLGTVNYRATDWLELGGGYRHLGVERRRNATDIDVGLSGPIVAATFRF